MLRGTIDTTEWDDVYARLLSSLKPDVLNRVGSKVLADRMRKTYDLRWKQAYPQGNVGVYAQKKADLGLPSGKLTGASREAISSEADASQGRVFLKGVWPGASLGDPFSDFEPESFLTKTYGGERTRFAVEGEIKWFVLFPEDDLIIASAIDALVRLFIDPKRGVSQELAEVLIGENINTDDI